MRWATYFAVLASAAILDDEAPPTTSFPARHFC